MLSSSKEALEALHDLNIILNPQKEVATVSNILENVHQIEIKVNYSQKNLEEKLKGTSNCVKILSGNYTLIFVIRKRGRTENASKP
jgi:hypothetical protein